VNIYTKVSQWERPSTPVYPPGAGHDVPPSGAPPGYDHGSARPLQPEKTGASTGEAIFGGGGATGVGSSHIDTSGDEDFARKLQEEENARLSKEGAGSRSAADSYYTQQGAGGGPAQYGPPGAQYSPGATPYDPNQLPPDTRASGSKSKGGFLGKLLGKSKMGGSSSQGGYPQQGYPQQGGYYQGPPQQGYGYAPQQGYYGQQGMRPQKSGMGAGGAAALGLGGGLVGGMLLGEALDGGDGGDGGGGDGDYGGGDGDYGGGDDGGGGDFGGGDF
jgi:hypothetical protein